MFEYAGGLIFDAVVLVQRDFQVLLLFCMIVVSSVSEHWIPGKPSFAAYQPLDSCL